MTTKPFTLHKRPTVSSNRYVYYAQFRDDCGRRLTAVSTGQTSKAAAERWAIQRLRSGTIPIRSNLTFDRFAKPWFVWDQCSYIRRKQDRGTRISRQYADTRRIFLKRHVIPYFETIRLSAIRPYMIEDWLDNLQETSLSTSTINVCLGILKIMMKEAYRLDYISADPASRVLGLKETPTHKSTLRLDEVCKLFKEDTIERVWGGRISHYALNLLAATTGMRQGEIQGLQRQHVHPNFVRIVNTWERRYGLKDHPKCGSYRAIPIPQITTRYLHQVMDNRSELRPDCLVFRSALDSYKPIGSSDIRKRFYQALEKIEILPTERQNRNLTFHSWRYFFNSLLRAQKIPDSKVRLLTGHRTQEMTEHYTQFQIEDLQDVLHVQENLFVDKGEEVADVN